MKDKQADYFVAIIPPSPVFENAMELKNYFQSKYNSKASLNSPPHITLHMPFHWTEEKENLLVEKLGGFAKPHERFEVTLSGFNCFKPRVIFIDVVENEKLKLLQKELHRFCKRELNLFNANHKDHAFHPHLTLAFRDLRKQQFLDAWNEFEKRSFSATFDVGAISLLKHDGARWNVLTNFSLGN